MPHNNSPASLSLDPTSEPDAHGQAALLLAESTLHALVAAGKLSTRDCVEAVELAKEIKVEVATETGESSKRMGESLALLTAIADSLRTDLLVR
jgi:hypothetical protein